MRARALLVGGLTAACLTLTSAPIAAAAIVDAPTDVGTAAGAPAACGAGWQRLDPSLRVPAGSGTLTQLSFTSVDAASPLAGGLVEYQVLRQRDLLHFEVVAVSGPQPDPGDGAVHDLPVYLPVRGGDVLGAYSITDVGCLKAGSRGRSTRQPQPVVGDIVTALGTSGTGRLNLVAHFEPDAFEAAGLGVSGVGTIFSFVVTSPTTGHARFIALSGKRRDGDLTCFARVGGAAVFGILDNASRPEVFREFAIRDAAAGDGLTELTGTPQAPPPATCAHPVPTPPFGLLPISGDIRVAPVVPEELLGT